MSQARTAGLGTLAAVLLAAPAAQATVTPQATDPATGFAFSFTDDRNDANAANDVVLGLCMDNSGNCVETPRPDVNAPVSVDPDNFTPDGEGFYNLADATLPGLGVGLVRLGQEVSFLTPPPWVPGQGTSFYRVRVRFDAGLKSDTWYRVTHPLGVEELQTDGAGAINFTNDLDGQAMPGFLQWASGAPAGYIGNYAVAHTVIGSPLGTNFVQVDELPGGPGTEPPPGAQPISFTDQFNVQGKLAGPPPAPAANAGLSKTRLNFGTRGLGTTSAAQSVTLTNNGTAAMTVNGMAVTGTDRNDFALTGNSCTGTNLAVGASCAVGVVFQPTAPGDRGATLTFADTAPGAPHHVTLTGVGGGSLPGANAGPGGNGIGGSGGSVLPRLSLGNLTTTKTIRRSRARSQGIRLVMRLPEGTQVVRIRILRRTKQGRRVISDGYKTPNTSGLYRVQQNHKALRRSLGRVGKYLVEVTPGRSKTDMGNVASYAFQVTR